MSSDFGWTIGPARSPNLIIRFATLLILLCGGMMMCVWSAQGLGDGWEVSEHRSTPDDPAAAFAYALRQSKLGVSITPLNIQVEHESGGMQGDGCDWYACDLSPADTARVRSMLPAERGGDFSAQMCNPPLWWAPQRCSDLLSRRSSESWMIALSPSRHRLFLRETRF